MIKSTLTAHSDAPENDQCSKTTMAWDGLPGSMPRAPQNKPQSPQSVSIVPTQESNENSKDPNVAELSDHLAEITDQVEVLNLADLPGDDGFFPPAQASRPFLDGEPAFNGKKLEPLAAPVSSKEVVADAQKSEIVQLAPKPALEVRQSLAYDADYHCQTKLLITAALQRTVQTLAEQHLAVLQLISERYNLHSDVVSFNGTGLHTDYGHTAAPPRDGRVPAVVPPPSTAPSLNLGSSAALEGTSKNKVSEASTNRQMVSPEPGTTEKHKHTLLEVWHGSGREGALRGDLKKNRRSGKESFLQGLGEEDEMEQGRNLESDSRFQKYIVHPYNPFRGTWDICSLCLVIYDMIMIPMGFFDPPETTFLVAMSWITRLYWSFDMPFTFITGFITVEGNIDLRPKSISKRYLRSWFGLDALVVGVDWIELLASAAAEKLGFARFTKASRVFRILRMIRLLRLARMTEVLNLLVERVDSEKLVIGIDVSKLLIIMIGFGHMIACLWYAIGKSTEGTWNWLYQENYVDTAFESKYLMSLRWAMSQFAGGMDEVVPYSVPENVFAVLIFLATFWSGAVFISILTSSMTQWYVMGSQLQQQLTTLRRYLSQNGISKKLALRVQRNAQHSVAEQQRTMPEEQVVLIGQVSEPLRLELHFEMFAPILQCHPFFVRYTEECPHVVRKVCHVAMKRADSFPGDVIFSVGEIPDHPRMFLIGDGIMEYKDFNASSSSIEGGEWVSEACLWVKWIHRGTLRAMGHTRLYTIDSNQFQSIVGQFEHLGGFDPRTYAQDFLDALNSMEETTDLHVDFLWGDEVVKSESAGRRSK